MNCYKVSQCIVTSYTAHMGQSWSTPQISWIWWRHQMETFSALLALCAGNSPVPGEFPSQRPVTPSLNVFFDLRLNKRLSKESRGWWFETPSRSLWRHCNEIELQCRLLWRSIVLGVCCGNKKFREDRVITECNCTNIPMFLLDIIKKRCALMARTNSSLHQKKKKFREITSSRVWAMFYTCVVMLNSRVFCIILYYDGHVYKFSTD